MKIKARLKKQFSKASLEKRIAFGLAILALLSGTATYLKLNDASLLEPGNRIVFPLLLVDLSILLLLGVVIAKRLVALWVERKRGSAGSLLHVRLVMLFGLVTAIPTIFMAFFSFLFFQQGVESWFNTRVQTALHDSVKVAQAYLKEHQRGIGNDASLMSRDLSRELPFLLHNAENFNRYLTTMAAVRSMREAIVFDEAHNILARSVLTFALDFEFVPDWALEKANADGVALLTSEDEDRVRAIVKIEGTPPAYLYVGRPVDPMVLNYVSSTEESVNDYDILERERSEIQIIFALIFVVVSLLLLLAAIRLGMVFSNQLAAPIIRLINAAEQLAKGDLSARVPEASAKDELGILSRTFNEMAAQTQINQQELIRANQKLDRRRQFTESVLSGVSAGVIGLDAGGNINYPNRSASQLLKTDLSKFLRKNLVSVFPEAIELLEKAKSAIQNVVEGEITRTHDGYQMIFLVRVTREQDKKGDLKGFVVTFDDLTEQLAAQRKAAWSDVARRVAHEIKNPLTPIQLSAERLKRKYLPQIQEDPQAFQKCIDTIVRQVGNIGNLIGEFSDFARMPSPVFEEEELRDMCQQLVLLQHNAHQDIDLKCRFPDEPIYVNCDANQVGQALTNLLQNAIDSIQERVPVVAGAALPKGNIVLTLTRERHEVRLTIEDNGKGLPKEGRERLDEPYYTTRTKGTGLGLAIVKKVMHDHGGTLVMQDSVGGGAEVTLLFRVEDAVVQDGDSVRKKQEMVQ